jgi:hypothetical protein
MPLIGVADVTCEPIDIEHSVISDSTFSRGQRSRSADRSALSATGAVETVTRFPPAANASPTGDAIVPVVWKGQPVCRTAAAPDRYTSRSIRVATGFIAKIRGRLVDANAFFNGHAPINDREGDRMVALITSLFLVGRLFPLDGGRRLR